MNLNKVEAVFFDVLEDLKDYLPDLTIVGGWMPYIYSNFLWKNFVRIPVTTADIDFGVDESGNLKHPKTIFETLSGLNYTERHPRMDRMFPVVLLKEKVLVEFITYPDVDFKAIEKLVGGQMQVNKIEKFDFLLKHRVLITAKAPRGKGTYVLNCPAPSAFLYHKGATFISRENKEKQAKDLYYMYFILRYTPDVDAILKEIFQFSRDGYFKSVSDNLAKFFERASSQGCLMVERENGPDEFIRDLRQDIFERFSKLRAVL
ncbi:MAG: hypothetical protein HQL20_02375 [Candidatus Omnitrophica bacterium]|nr:hypothetical protein [Candidatus Omnitrophota bacterium]